MGATAVIATALCFLLSETNGEPTKEVLTIDERENASDHSVRLAEITQMLFPNTYRIQPVMQGNSPTCLCAEHHRAIPKWLIAQHVSKIIMNRGKVIFYVCSYVTSWKIDRTENVKGLSDTQDSEVCHRPLFQLIGESLEELKEFCSLAQLSSTIVSGLSAFFTTVI
eukprot:gene5287-5954_t